MQKQINYDNYVRFTTQIPTKCSNNELTDIAKRRRYFHAITNVLNRICEINHFSFTN